MSELCLCNHEIHLQNLKRNQTYLNIIYYIIIFCTYCLNFKAQRNNIKVELVDDTYTRLRGEISGPPDTPYEGKLVVLSI